jgi:hypothetical protein
MQPVQNSSVYRRACLTYDNHGSADYSIYLLLKNLYLLLKNFGDSWTGITSGIPASVGTVHVLRKDPANPNLLFAGTGLDYF